MRAQAGKVGRSGAAWRVVASARTLIRRSAPPSPEREKVNRAHDGRQTGQRPPASRPEPGRPDARSPIGPS